MISLEDISAKGSNLVRPECVLSNAEGRLFTSDWRGGVSIIEADGSQWSLLSNETTFDVKPNGIALVKDGSFLLAHLGGEDGGVYRLQKGGTLTEFLTDIDGAALPPTNFVHIDYLDRIWISVSTRQHPRAKGYTASVTDGFIILIDNMGARIVADNLGYTNECIVHPDGKRLFVNETFSKRMSSFDISDDGKLSNKLVIAEFGDGVFPDGLTFDQNGDAWITSIISNRVIKITADGKQHVMIDDSNSEHVAEAETAYRSNEMGRPHLDIVKSKKLQNISSLAFGGPDLKTGYLGCLLGDSISTFKSPIAGHVPAHWHFKGPDRTS